MLVVYEAGAVRVRIGPTAAFAWLCLRVRRRRQDGAPTWEAHQKPIDVMHFTLARLARSDDLVK